MKPDFSEMAKLMQARWGGCNPQGTLVLSDLVDALSVAYNMGLDRAEEIFNEVAYRRGGR